MSGHQHATINDTVYFWFAANDTSGSGGDGATPLYDVREAGAAAGAIPLLSGTPTLLTHANYPAGCYEVSVAATTGNGFAADDTFAVFCTLAIDSQNPTGFVGSCTLTPLAKTAALATAQTDLDTLTGTDGVTLATTQANYAPLQPTTAGRTLDVTVGGTAGIDWANIESPTTAVDLSGTDIQDITTIAGTAAANQINNQMVDVMTTDTVAEMAQGAPPLSPSMEDILNYMYREFIRNRVVVNTDGTDQKQIYADDGTTILYEKGLTDAASILTIDEATTGA